MKIFGTTLEKTVLKYRKHHLDVIKARTHIKVRNKDEENFGGKREETKESGGASVLCYSSERRFVSNSIF